MNAIRSIASWAVLICLLTPWWGIILFTITSHAFITDAPAGENVAATVAIEVAKFLGWYIGLYTIATLLIARAPPNQRKRSDMFAAAIAINIGLPTLVTLSIIIAVASAIIKPHARPPTDTEGPAFYQLPDSSAGANHDDNPQSSNSPATQK